MSADAPDDTDRWLREALRHAPDAHEPVPPALADTILRAARAQTLQARPRPAPVPAPRTRWWAWLDALARPQVSGAIASVMLATVLGLMWWDMPVDVAVPTNEPAAASSPPPAAAREEDQARPSPGTDTADRANRNEEHADSRTPAMRGESRSARQRQAEQQAEQRAAEKKSADTPRAAAEAEARKALRRSDVPQPPPPDTPAPANSGMPTPSPAAAPVMAPAAPSIAAPVAAPAPPPAQPSETGDERPVDIRDKADPAPALRQRAAGSLAAAPVLAPLTESLADDPSRWQWQFANDEAQPVTPALIDWLRALDRATTRGWTPADGSTATGGPVATVRLLRDGQTRHLWTLHGDHVAWVRAGAAFTAPLDPDTALRLRQALMKAR